MVMIRELSRQYLGQGNRVVHAFSNETVVKYGCPLSPQTGGQSRIEASVWERYKNVQGIQDCLVPVLDYATDGSWLLMPKVTTLSKSGLEYRELDSLIDALKGRIYRMGLNVDTADFHSGNLGILPNGLVVALDYGYDGIKFHYGKARKCSGCHWSLLVMKKYVDMVNGGVPHRGRDKV